MIDKWKFWERTRRDRQLLYAWPEPTPKPEIEPCWRCGAAYQRSRMNLAWILYFRLGISAGHNPNDCYVEEDCSPCIAWHKLCPICWETHTAPKTHEFLPEGRPDDCVGLSAEKPAVCDSCDGLGSKQSVFPRLDTGYGMGRERCEQCKGSSEGDCTESEESP